MHEAELPLTPTQEGMLFNGLAEAGAEVQQLVVQPPRSFDDVEQMRLAWGAALARHPMLRASFRWRGVTAPCQRVHEAVELPWEVLHQELDREAALRLFLRLDRLTPLPLERAPAFRLTLLRARDGDALVWTHHHAQLDGRSLELVLLDVLGALAGAPPPAAPSPSVEPHLRAIEAGRGPRQDEFFASRFADLWEPTPLPGPRPAASAEAEADERHLEHEYMVCGEWLDALERQGEAEGFTLATAIQAAWATVLARYAGTSDVTFGVTRACRHVTSESAAMVGCLINTVPLRVDVDASPSARALARSLRAESLALREHETVALRRVAELSPLTSAADLARSVVVVEGHGLEDRVRASFPELASWRLSLRGRSAAPLTLAAYRHPDGLQLVVEHDRRRVAASIASTLGRRVERALRAFATDLDRAPAEAPLTFSTEHAPLRGEDVAIDTSPPTFPARFVAAAERSPHKVALVDEATGREVSYAELLAQARACVERLRADGAKAGDVVAVWAGRRVETIEAMVACALGGLVYFPLDPAYPPDRTAFVLRDSGARWYLAPSYVPATDLPPLDDVTLVRLEPPAAPRPPELADAPRVVGLDDGPHTAARRDRGPADHADATTPAAGEAAYLIYTSGSTGTPKGVLVSHGNLAAHTSAALETYALSDSDRGMLFASPSFDVSLEEVVPLLSVGGSLVIRSDATASSPDRLLSTVASHGVTVLQLPTAFFHELARHMERRRASLPASVRLVVIGGERASASACRRFRSVAPDVRLVNAYGPTEVTITATSYDVPREVPSTIPIGRPFGRCHAYVLDARGAPVPTGARGELALGGPQVAIGYHDRPEPTAARFVADPVDPSRGRVYLTGDLVQLGAGGELEFLGRRDGQVKVRGFRIELAEVEAALEQDDDVAEAVATVLDAPSGEPTLVAFVVGRTPRLDLVAIDRRLRQRLPPQHVPARIASLDALPRAPGGKLDRRALQWPAAAAASATTEPVSADEARLLDLFREVLESPEMGVDDRFFDRGGSSIRAVRLISRIEEELQGAPTVATILTHQTPRAIAAWLREHGQSTPSESLVLLNGDHSKRTPLYCLLGLHLYEEMARSFRRPVYGVYVEEDLEAMSRAVRTPDLAAAYLRAIERQAGQPPKLLLGFSYGALVAFEAAQQLTRRGTPPDLLVMLDPLLPSMLEEGPLDRAYNLAARLLRDPASIAPRLARRVAARVRALDVVPTRATGDDLVWQIRERAYMRASEDYEANELAPYPGRCQVYVAQDRSPAHTPRVVAGWRSLIRQCEIHVVPGDHGTLLQPPYVDEIAERLGSALRARTSMRMLAVDGE